MSTITRAEVTTDPYDTLRYDAHPVPLAHPARLATAALLKGWDCPPPSACRMLELGCADATHLLPIAVANPDSHFVGVERSGPQIEAARADVEALGLKNVELIQADFLDLDERLGRFDYIVAHGVFSWVSDAARARILALFAAGLSERGVGYLSYNTKPGWGVRGYLRDLLLEHTRAVSEPRAKVARARGYLAAILDSSAGTGADPYGSLLGEIVRSLAARSDSYLMHEYLTEHNRAFAFAEMVSSLGEHGLCVLDDLVRSTRVPAHHQALHAGLGVAGLGPVEIEGAVDLLTNRRFRASLIGRDDEPRSSRPVSVLHVISRCEVALAAPATRVGGPTGPESLMPARLAEEAVSVLASVWPGSLGIHDLILRVGSTVSRSSTGVVSKDHDVLLGTLMRLVRRGYLELRAHPPSLVSCAGERPLVSPLTRLDAARGRRVTNQLHESVTLEPVVAEVAVLLDGTRDATAVARELRRAHGGGRSLDALRAEVETSLDVLADHALLLG